MAVTAVWGATFVVVQDVVEVLPVMDFLAVRFLLAAAIMVAIRPRALARLSPVLRRRAVVMGTALAGGYILQTVGLQYTSATVSGFITGMFVVFTPIIAWILGDQRVTAAGWAGVALATVGLALLSLKGTSLGVGEAVTLGGAAMFAVHIVLLGRWSTREDAYGLAVLQLLTVGALCLVMALPDGVDLPPDAATWGRVLFLSVFATAVAFVVQTWAQTHVTPTRAAIVMTMEPVFAGLFGVLAGEALTARIVAGGACVLAAMFLVELGPRKGADAAVERLEA
jgi:drug/metabolite transporter (DMT)-like permease